MDGGLHQVQAGDDHNHDKGDDQMNDTDKLAALFAETEDTRAWRITEHRSEMAKIHETARREMGRPVPSEQPTEPLSVEEMLDDELINDLAAQIEGGSKLGAFTAWHAEHELWTKRAHELLAAHADGDFAEIQKGFTYAAED